MTAETYEEVTGVTVVTPTPLQRIFDRLDTLTDALATSNRAAIAHARELRSLRYTIIWAIIVLFALLLKGSPSWA